MMRKPSLQSVLVLNTNNVPFPFKQNTELIFVVGLLEHVGNLVPFSSLNLFWVLFLASTLECFLLDSVLPFS